jgi:hypothetical protein
LIKVSFTRLHDYYLKWEDEGDEFEDVTSSNDLTPSPVFRPEIWVTGVRGKDIGNTFF